MSVITDPSAIEYLRLRTLEKALFLEVQGMTRRGRSVYAIVKDMGYRGNKRKVWEAFKKDLDNITKFD
jgi:hypothetical protein